MNPLKDPASTRELIPITRQLALMVRSGVPIIKAFEIVGKQQKRTALGKALNAVIESLANGETISSGIRRSPQVFSELYSTLIEAGEHAGILDQALDTLGDQLQAQRELRGRLIRISIYPLVVLAVLGAITIFLLTWVIPTFEELFSESGVPLPWLTKGIIASSRFITNAWPIWIALIALLPAGLIYLKSAQRDKSIKIHLSRLIIHLPVIGELIKAKNSAEFASLLATLIRVGIPLIEGLELSARTVGNQVIKAEILRVQTAISAGHTFTYALNDSSYFPPMLKHLIEVGESSGGIESMLIKAAELNKAKFDETTETLKQLIEPVLILAIGAIVGVTVLGLYLPIFQIGELAGMR